MAPVPHVKVLLGDIASDLLSSDEAEVAVPKQMLLQLLELYLSCWDFDEDWYLSKYPDVRDAVKSGALDSGWTHFKAIGYLEGRVGAPIAVDSDWYLETYPDVAKAVIDGHVTNVQNHYTDFGHAEGRFPRDPKIDLKWYKARYLSSPDTQELKGYKDALEHFVRISYLKFAVPAMPR
jgi:hypothetical protein